MTNRTDPVSVQRRGWIYMAVMYGCVLGPHPHLTASLQGAAMCCGICYIHNEAVNRLWTIKSHDCYIT